MSEWTKPSVKTPDEGEHVEIRIPGGRCIKNVEFASGRFWKVRTGNGGQAYTVEAWRAPETRTEGRKKRTIDGPTQDIND